MIFFLAFDSYSQSLDSTLRESLDFWKANVQIVSSMERFLNENQILMMTPQVQTLCTPEFFQQVELYRGPKVLWLDWSHLQFPEDLITVSNQCWDHVFSCVPKSLLPKTLWDLPISELKSPVLSHNSRIYRQLEEQPQGKLSALFLSQPLRQDRGGDFDQFELFERVKRCEFFREIENWTVVSHPREDRITWESRSVHVLTATDLKTGVGRDRFTWAVGYNTLALLEADMGGLGVVSARLENWPPNRMNLEDLVV